MKYSSEQIGEIIKKERKKRGWSQAKLGEKIGLSDKQISKYEKGESKPTPSVETLFKLCEVFDCELGYLLGEKSYSCGTKIDTDIVAITGLSLEAIRSIQKLTGIIEQKSDSLFSAKNFQDVFKNNLDAFSVENNSDIFSIENNQKKIKTIFNKFLISETLVNFFESVYDLEFCIENVEKGFQYIVDKYGKDRFNEIIASYNNIDNYVTIDNSNSQLSNEQTELLGSYLLCNLAIKFAKSEVYETFKKLIDEIYPNTNTKL